MTLALPTSEPMRVSVREQSWRTRVLLNTFAAALWLGALVLQLWPLIVSALAVAIAGVLSRVAWIALTPEALELRTLVGTRRIPLASIAGVTLDGADLRVARDGRPPLVVRFSGGSPLLLPDRGTRAVRFASELERYRAHSTDARAHAFELVGVETGESGALAAWVERTRQSLNTSSYREPAGPARAAVLRAYEDPRLDRRVRVAAGLALLSSADGGERDRLRAADVWSTVRDAEDAEARTPLARVLDDV